MEEFSPQLSQSEEEMRRLRGENEQLKMMVAQMAKDLYSRSPLFNQGASHTPALELNSSLTDGPAQQVHHLRSQPHFPRRFPEACSPLKFQGFPTGVSPWVPQSLLSANQELPRVHLPPAGPTLLPAITPTKSDTPPSSNESSPAPSGPPSPYQPNPPTMATNLSVHPSVHMVVQNVVKDLVHSETGELLENQKRKIEKDSGSVPAVKKAKVEGKKEDSPREERGQGGETEGEGEGEGEGSGEENLPRQDTMNAALESGQGTFHPVHLGEELNLSASTPRRATRKVLLASTVRRRYGMCTWTVRII